MEILNKTIPTELILKGFPGNPTVQLIAFVMILLDLIVTLAGNIIIIVIICTDNRLHSPMYFFLVCLSVMEITGIPFVTPKMLATFIKKKVTLSKAECFTQSYVYFFISSSDFLLLSVMSIDRYVAISYPLQYTSIMKNSLCVSLVVGCLFLSFFCLLYPFMTIPTLHFCGHVLDHFFCDSAAILKLICSDTRLLKLSGIIASVFILIVPLAITTLSYIFIIATVIRLPSKTGRQKTFSTCMSHLTMVSIVFGSAIFIEIRPSKKYSIETDKVLHLVSTLMSPLLNPFIYTLRNQKVKNCIWDAMKQKKKHISIFSYRRKGS